MSLAFIDLKDHKLSASMGLNRGDQVGEFWWVAPNRVAVSVATRDGPLDQPASTEKAGEGAGSGQQAQ